MFILYIYIFIFLLLLPERFIMKEETNGLGKAIGNMLSDYFYKMGCAWSKNETFVWKEYDEYNNDFYKKLPRSISPRVVVPEYKSHTGWEGQSAWTIDTNEGKLFWDTMKPHIHTIIDKALKESGLHIQQNIPILHFRCSDAPFNKLGSYHFAKYKFYKDALEGYKEVDIFSCNTHAAVGTSDEKNQIACDKYVNYLIKELEAKDIKVNLNCGNYFEDFAKMFYAPLVISPGSSMSFMAGYFGHGELITSGHVFDEFAGGPDCKICSHPRNIDLMHSEVEDYYDTEKVHNQLKEKYFLSVIGHFKNEGHIIKEWIKHYVSEGVEHFYLIDNGSTDNYEEEIGGLPVTIIKDDRNVNQMILMQENIFHLKDDSEWLIYVDLDEFMYGVDKPISHILKDVEDDVGKIVVPWKMFGSSGHIKQPTNVVDNFLYRKFGDYDTWTKCIVRSSCLKNLQENGHDLRTQESKKSLYSTFEPWWKSNSDSEFAIRVTEKDISKMKIRMNHYIIQSEEWFRQIKMSRGDAATMGSNHRDMNYFKQHDTNDIYDDELKLKRMNHF